MSSALFCACDQVVRQRGTQTYQDALPYVLLVPFNRRPREYAVFPTSVHLRACKQFGIFQQLVGSFRVLHLLKLLLKPECNFVRTGSKILFNHVGALFQSIPFWTRFGHASQKILYWLIIWKLVCVLIEWTTNEATVVIFLINESGNFC